MEHNTQKLYVKSEEMYNDLNKNININININDDMDINDKESFLNTNINNILAKSIGKEFTPTNISYETIHSIPKQHGLVNSKEIIPQLYFEMNKNKTKFLDIDYYEIIRNDIANCRYLNSYQLEYIEKYLLHEEKMDLFYLYNNVLRMIDDSASYNASTLISIEDSLSPPLFLFLFLFVLLFISKLLKIGFFN